MRSVGVGLELGLDLELRLNTDLDAFVQESVAFAGSTWTERFHAVAARASVREAPTEIGPARDPADRFARTNRWLLEGARRASAVPPVLILLWDGQPGDGPGGASEMHRQAVELGGPIEIISTRRLSGLLARD